MREIHLSMYASQHILCEIHQRDNVQAQAELCWRTHWRKEGKHYIAEKHNMAI